MATASMARLALWVANLVSANSPTTRLFGLRSHLYRRGGVEIGEGTRIAGGVRIPFALVAIGRNCWIGPGSHLIAATGAPVRIGDNCDLAPEVMLVVGSHELGSEDRRAGAGTARPVTIGSGCWLGARATVLGGVTLGSGSVVAAGALVVDDVDRNVLVGGVPAKMMRRL